MRPRSRALVLASLVASLPAALVTACVEPPPRIAAIPPSGLALRLHVFGASAQEVRRAFEAVRENNKTFTLVREGGDGEVLVGLENDSPVCAPPTALCSFKVAVRVRDNDGHVLHQGMTEAAASAERCSDLCEKAVNQLVVKVVELASTTLKAGESAAALAAEAADGGAGDADAPPPSEPEEPAAADAGAPRAAKKGAKAPAARADGSLCAVAKGPSLQAEEAERRAAQVEVLKRIGVLDEADYDCLRKAYLARL